MGLKWLIRYRESSKAQIFKELKVQGWVWGLFCTRRWGKYSHQTAEETQGNKPVDSYHHKMNVFNSSEQLCNGRGEPSNKTLWSGEPLRETQIWTHLEQQSSPCLHRSLLGNQKASSKMAEAFKYTTVLLSKWGMSSAHPTGTIRYQVSQSHGVSVIFVPSQFFKWAFSKHSKARLSLLLQSDVFSNHF